MINLQFLLLVLIDSSLERFHSFASRASVEKSVIATGIIYISVALFPALLSDFSL